MKYLLEQWLVGVLALVGFQLLMFLKGLLTTFKTALFSKRFVSLVKNQRTVHNTILSR